MEKQNV